MLRGFENVYCKKEMLDFTLQNLHGPHCAKKDIESNKDLKQIYKCFEYETLNIEDAIQLLYMEIDIIADIVKEICKLNSTFLLRVDSKSQKGIRLFT